MAVSDSLIYWRLIMEQGKRLTDAEREVLNALVDSKAVDFEAVGKALATLGPNYIKRAADTGGKDIFIEIVTSFICLLELPPLPDGGPIIARVRELQKIAEDLKLK